MSENQKRLLQQALDMLEEQALHIEAPMLPAGEELLKRIRAAISQQVEPAQCTNEDSWNCKYCRNTDTCEALADKRNFGEPTAAQTEQQPIGYACQADLEWEDEPIRICRERFRDWQLPVYSAPIAQTAPRCEQPDAFEVARHSKRLVEQLRAENTRLKAECEQLSETVMGQERVIEALEPDARRYRTLRQMHWNDGPLAVVANPKASVKLGADCPSGERLDQMLDEIEEQRTPR